MTILPNNSFLHTTLSTIYWTLYATACKNRFRLSHVFLTITLWLFPSYEEGYGDSGHLSLLLNPSEIHYSEIGFHIFMVQTCSHQNVEPLGHVPHKRHCPLTLQNPRNTLSPHHRGHARQTFICLAWCGLHHRTMSSLRVEPIFLSCVSPLHLAWSPRHRWRVVNISWFPGRPDAELEAQGGFHFISSGSSDAGPGGV